MENCEFCNLTSEDERWLFYTSEFWKVYLSDKQDYIGRCIVVSKRHCESLSSLSIQEWDDLKRIVNSLEDMFAKTLNATMFNWTCLMNNAYKEIILTHMYIFICVLDLNCLLKLIIKNITMKNVHVIIKIIKKINLIMKV